MRYLILIGMVCIQMLNAAGGGMADLANSAMYGATVKKYEAEQKRKSDAQQKSETLTVMQQDAFNTIRTQPDLFAAVLIKDGEGVDFVHAVRERYKVKLQAHKKKQGCFSCCSQAEIVHAEKMLSDGTVQTSPDSVDENDKDFIFCGDSSGKVLFIAPVKRCKQLARECTHEQISYIRMLHTKDNQHRAEVENKKAMVAAKDLEEELKKMRSRTIILTERQRALHTALPEHVRKSLEDRLGIDVMAKERAASVDVAIHSPYEARDVRDTTNKATASGSAQPSPAAQAAAAASAAAALNGTTESNRNRPGSTHSVELGQTSMATVRASVGNAQMRMHRDSADEQTVNVPVGSAPAGQSDVRAAAPAAATNVPTIISVIPIDQADSANARSTFS